MEVSVGDMIRKVPPCLEGLVPYTVGHLATDESNEILIPEAVRHIQRFGRAL